MIIKVPMGNLVHSNLVTSVQSILSYESVDWRYSQLGMLQHANYQHQYRIQIWHPDLVVPDMFMGGALHSHEFEMTSYILYGSLMQQTYDVIHTRLKQPVYWLYSMSQMHPKEVNALLKDYEQIDKGYLYHQTANTFHYTQINEFCINIMFWKGNLSRKAMILDKPQFVQTVKECYNKTRYLDMARDALNSR
jgi:hypothetical protein